MLEIKLNKQFKKDINRDKISVRYNESDFARLRFVMDVLIEGKNPNEKYLPHLLSGNWKGYSECHIKPNWLLIYKQDKKVIKFARIGTHQQLFK